MEKYYRSGFMQLSFAKMQGGFVCSRFGYSVNASQIIGREGTIITLYKKNNLEVLFIQQPRFIL